MSKTGKLINFIVLTFILLVLIIPAYSLEQEVMKTDSDKPSDWAEEEVYAAIKDGLVPEELQAHYQKNITRNQYVLLALKVFDLSGNNLVYNETAPFSDTLNHEKEAEITRAYNAGIIKGDGKGHFFPDNEITREEIASLIVNLLMQITPERDYTPSNEYEYADGNEISGWAKNYINYCFENKIINGTGKNEAGLDKMAPKEGATVEQSIALIYRLANKEGLIKKSNYGTITLYDGNEPNAETIDRFVSVFGESIFNIMQELSKDESIDVMDMRGESITLSLKKTNTIILDDTGYEKAIFGLFFDINDDLTIDTFKQLVNTFNNPQPGITKFMEFLPRMQDGEYLDVYDVLNDDNVFIIKSSKDESNTIYSMYFIQK